MTNIPRKENKNIEFKEKLIPEIHLREEKRQHLASQMKYLLEVGNGTVIYVIGVDDNGILKNITELEFEQSINVLKIIASECNAQIIKIEKFIENGNLIGKVVISKSAGNYTKTHLIVGVAGHVHHGKSTLVATLITGKSDLNGKNWLYLNVLPHEIERNLSADLHYALYGFSDGIVLNLKNPLDRKERAKIVEKANKIISFVDTVGHEPWLRTTIRGLLGQDIDYGLLVVAVDDGVTHITKEHLGILLALNLPVIICLTKVDKVSEKKTEYVEKQVEDLLKNVGRVPFPVKDENDVNVVIDKLEIIVPILRTSAVNLQGYDLLNKILSKLPERKKDLAKPFLMYIDKIYNVSGVGTVVSGTIKQGRLIAGKELLLGPDKTGSFRKVKAASIEMHYQRLAEANAGYIVGIALRGIKHEDVERGMILCEEELKPKAVRSFEAEILVLNHPTRIASGYEPVIHLSTISETAKLKCIDKNYLKAGDTGIVRFTFKYSPHFVQVDDKFVFREGKTKGIGRVIKIIE